MRKKNDDLLSLAFGELSAESARAVEARTSGDASAREELEAMRELRSGLQRLPPPPPDTLSAERLRAAILDRELRERRTSPLGWAWAPVAVAAFAAFLFVSRPTPKGDVQIVSPGSVAVNDKKPEPFGATSLGDFRFPDAEAFRVPAASPTKVSVPPPVEARHRATKQRRRPEPTQERSGSDLMVWAPPKDPAPVEDAGVDEPTTMAAPTSDVVEGGAYRGGPESVVIVSSKRDLDTGARAGTETEASNVVVGG